MNVKDCYIEIPTVFGWIEFPVWATELHKLRSIIENARQQVKECEQNGRTIRLYDIVSNGRFSNLESAFQSHFVPFDCGGEDPFDHTPWAGWWRPGYRYLVVYEITSSGEELMPLNELRSLVNSYNDDSPLCRALIKLITKHDPSPPTMLADFHQPNEYINTNNAIGPNKCNKYNMGFSKYYKRSVVST